MKVISDPTTIIVTSENGKRQILFNVITVDYNAPKEVYHDCSKNSAPLTVIKKLIDKQGYIKVRLWNNQTLIATRYIHDERYDNLEFDDGTLLSNMNVPHFNPSRVAYAVFGYYENSV